MTCNMAACYRKRPVDDKSEAVDFKGEQNFGEPQRDVRDESVNRYLGAASATESRGVEKTGADCSR